MTTHYLKTWPDPFADLAAGAKTFELRRDDRDFQPGDWLVLQEWSLRGNGYTGAWVTAHVTHLLRGIAATQFGLQAGYCVMSIRVTERTAVAGSAIVQHDPGSTR